jgi:hypothetical protein
MSNLDEFKQASRQASMQSLLDTARDTLGQVRVFSADFLKMVFHFLLLINGGALLASMAFLGAIPALNTTSFLWILIGMVFFSADLLLTLYTCLRMARAFGKGVNKCFDDHLRLVTTLSYLDVPEQKEVAAPSKNEDTTDDKLAVAAFCLLIFGIGCIANSLLFIKFPCLPWYSLFGTGFSLVISAIFWYFINQLLKRDL